MQKQIGQWNIVHGYHEVGLRSEMGLVLSSLPAWACLVQST